MISYIFVRSDGAVVGGGSVQRECAEALFPPPDCTTVIGLVCPPAGGYYCQATGTVVPLPVKPHPWCQFDYGSRRWVVDAGAIRDERSRLLASCDWTQVTDSPLTPEQKQAWADYRQALRDFPSTCDPNNPVWPVRPD